MLFFLSHEINLKFLKNPEESMYLGRILIISVTLFIFWGCGESEDPSRPNTFTPLSSIEITAPLTSLAQGTSTPLTAIGNFSGLFSRTITEEVLWSSSDPQVAAVSNQVPTRGRVSGLAPGTTQIHAELEGIRQSLDITITDDLILALTTAPPQAELPQGISMQLAATGSFAGGDQDLTFDADWSSVHPDIARVGNEPSDKGRLTGVAPGETQIFARFGATEAVIPVTVTEAQLESLSLSPGNPALANLVAFAFQAKGTFSSGAERDLTAEVDWSSSNSTVARVGNSADDKGLVTTLNPGNTAIRGTFGGHTATSTLNVVGSPASGLSLTPAAPRIALNTSLQMEAQAFLSAGGSQAVTDLVTWSSTNPNVATISNASGQRGRVTAQNPGETRIRAVLGDLDQVEILLQVTSAPFVALEITPDEPFPLPPDSSRMLRARGFFADLSVQDISRDVTWNSTAPSIASVQNTGPERGRVRGLAPGSTLIQITFANLSSEIGLSVADLALESLALSPVERRVTAGQSLDFTLTGRFNDGRNRELTRDANWTSSESETAVISNEPGHQGTARGLSPGTAIIKAEFDNLEVETTLTVD